MGIYGLGVEYFPYPFIVLYFNKKEWKLAHA